MSLLTMGFKYSQGKLPCSISSNTPSLCILYRWDRIRKIIKTNSFAPWKKSYDQPRQHIRRRHWHPTPVLLPGKSHGWSSLMGRSPWGHYKLDTTERLHFHLSLACTGEGNGNPLQCSCLENPRDGRASSAAIYGVAQSRTRLKRLSSSSFKMHQLAWQYFLAVLSLWVCFLFFLLPLPLPLSPILLAKMTPTFCL